MSYTSVLCTKVYLTALIRRGKSRSVRRASLASSFVTITPFGNLSREWGHVMCRPSNHCRKQLSNFTNGFEPLSSPSEKTTSQNNRVTSLIIILLLNVKSDMYITGLVLGHILHLNPSNLTPSIVVSGLEQPFRNTRTLCSTTKSNGEDRK